MTIGGWTVFVMTASLIFVVAIIIAAAFDHAWIGAVIATFLTLAAFAAFQFYYNHTAIGMRAIKSEESNLSGGINRSVEVYDATGNLLKTYHGKFDVAYDSNRIIFDDENNMRHVIYYQTGTVIIDENE